MATGPTAGLDVTLRRDRPEVIASVVALGSDEAVHDAMFQHNSTEGRQLRRTGRIIDLGDAWHALHVFLAGFDDDSDLPQGFLLEAELVTGSLNMPVRVLDPGETLAVSRLLATRSTFDLADWYDPARLMAAQVYPEHWLDGSDHLPELIRQWRKLAAFMSAAAAAGEAVALTEL